MIISEKQIMQLMNIAKDYQHTLSTMISSGMATGFPHDVLKSIASVLLQITNQQSEELKVIE